MTGLLIFAWLACAPITGFLVVRYAWKMDWTWSDLGASIILCVLGPIWGLIGLIFSPLSDKPIFARRENDKRN